MAIGFPLDTVKQACPVTICSILDGHTWTSIGGPTERWATAERFTAPCEDVVAARDAPAVLRSGNGPGFISDAKAEGSGNRSGLSCIPPGSP